MPDFLLLNLGLTILLESPFWLLGLRAKGRLRATAFLVLINSFTLPLATYAYNGLQWNFFLVESLVFITEFLFCTMIASVSPSRALMIAFSANFCSAAAGKILQYLSWGF